MAVDLYRSRRGNFLKCEYWKRDLSIRDNSKYIHEKSPAGFFYAKIISDKNNDNQNVGGNWLVQSNQITVETEDIINVVAGDLVRFHNIVWLVERIAETSYMMKNYEFSQKASKKTVITMRKGA